MVPLRQIAAAVCVHALKLDKFVRRHLRFAHITSADAVAYNQQLARHARGQQITVLVDHHHFDICHRFANRNLIPGHLVERTANRRLRRPIAVESDGVRSQRHNFIVKRLRERLCTHVKDLNL